MERAFAIAFKPLEFAERLLLQARIHLGHKIMWDDRRIIVRVSRTRIVKGPCSLQEVEALEFVAEHCPTLLPRIYRQHQQKSGVFVEMEFVQGQRLDQIWPTRTEAERQRIVGQILTCLLELRALTQPASLHGLVAGSAVSGSSLHDGVFGDKVVGPFNSLEAFDKATRENPNIVHLRGSGSAHSQPSETVFTHADLAPRNIICRGDGTLCFVDWEFAGWWPTWWEAMKCNFADFPSLPGWLDQMNNAFRTRLNADQTA